MYKNIFLETAKNGSLTCKYNINGKWKYLYSTYFPEKIKEKISVSGNTACIVQLGLGLGYELEYLKKNTNKPIYVIEADLQFYELLKSNSDLLNNVKVLGKDNYKEIPYEFSEIQVFENTNLIQCDIPFYTEVLKFLKSERNYKEIVGIFPHDTIAADCKVAFEQIGFKTSILAWANESTILNEIIKAKPDYLFSINFSPTVAKLSNSLGIPYISWTVDTPAYTLYEKENLNYKYSYMFVYDKKVMSELRERGLKNIHYMPVAANVDRLGGINSREEGNLKYVSEVSFLGGSCIQNEYMTYFKDRLTPSHINHIEEMIQLQSQTSEYILKEMVTDNLVDEIENITSLTIDRQKHELLPKSEKFAFLLGRYHSYKERKLMMQELAKEFDLSIYGDEGWITKTEAKLEKCYKGYAEHFNEMPKVFMNSIVNVNITRSFVETGLPMRVFDVLGCKGFLATNHKLDIDRLFSDGHDLVKYRDLQDLKELIRYYLNHEEDRNRIRTQGFETIRKYHTYEIRIKNIMNIVNQLQKREG
ncbi:glycosyltransferase [Sporosarcina sp. 179-K 3D1 HS]|uniref:CgeB family protein n=1 Tax=Sporosarcina sp. 179-K 3D1 HS TaxID=3232169 RepID=UPI0039A1EF99